jgi:hypothetical protein
MWRIGKIGGYLSINLELACILNLQDGGSGELLGDRPDFVVRVHTSRKLAVQRAQPASAQGAITSVPRTQNSPNSTLDDANSPRDDNRRHSDDHLLLAPIQ